MRDGGSHVLRAHAEPAAHNAAVLAQLFNDFFREIDRNGKAYADIAAGLTEDRAIDAHNFPGGIDQRSAAVPRIDRSIGLNKVVIGTGSDHTPLGADDPRRHRMFQTERIADRHDPIANIQLSRRAELGEREIAG